MHKIDFALFASLVVLLALGSGCASSRSEEDPVVSEEEAFTPIRAKYRAVTPGDLPVTTEALRVAVVDLSVSGENARLSFFPALYRPKSGYCEMLAPRKEASGVAALVKAIDPYVDRMPFGVLFTSGGRVASDPDTAAALPAAFSDLYAQFQEEMRKADIEFVCLMPPSVTFLQ